MGLSRCGRELLADGGAAARARRASFARRASSTPRASPTRCGSSSPSGSRCPADRPRDRRARTAVDAISPYGYPGATSRATAPARRRARSTGRRPAWSASSLRDRLGGRACARRGTERSRVQVHDPAAPRSVRARLAEQIRAQRARRLGGRGARRARRVRRRARGLRAAPTRETMRRAGAAERYFFEPGVLRRGALASTRTWLLLARRSDGELGAGAIAARQRRRPPLLPRRHRRRGARARRRSRTWSSRCSTSPTSSACRSTSAAGSAPATGSRRSSAASPTPSCPFAPTSSSATRAPTSGSRAGRDAGGFFPAYRACR